MRGTRKYSTKVCGTRTSGGQYLRKSETNRLEPEPVWNEQIGTRTIAKRTDWNHYWRITNQECSLRQCDRNQEVQYKSNWFQNQWYSEPQETRNKQLESEPAQNEQIGTSTSKEQSMNFRYLGYIVLA